MAAPITWWILTTTAATPNWFGFLQEGGSAPSAATTAYGYIPGNATNLYFRGRQGASAAVATSAALASSWVASTSGPTKGTGSASTTAGDSFITPNTYTGVFDSSAAWQFNWIFRPTIAGTIGQVNMRVWASVNADGTSARELTAGAVNGSINTLASTSTDYNSQITWSPGAITLTNEYLFFQLEWQITTTGSVNQTARVRAGSNSFITSAPFTAFVPSYNNSYNEIVSTAWAASPGPQPLFSTQLLTAIEEGTPPFGGALPEPTLAAYAWIPPDPPPTLPHLKVPPSVPLGFVSRAPLDKILASWIPPDPQPPVSAPEAAFATPTVNNPPMGRGLATRDIITAAWVEPNPLPTLPHPLDQGLPFIPSSRASLDKILASWIESNPQPQINSLHIQAPAPPTAFIPSSNSSNEIIVAWSPAASTEILFAPQLLTGAEVDNPPFGGSLDVPHLAQRAWDADDPLPTLPRHKPPAPAVQAALIPCSSALDYSIITPVWVEPDTNPQIRRLRTPPSQAASSVFVPRSPRQILNAILGAWATEATQPILPTQLNPDPPQVFHQVGNDNISGVFAAWGGGEPSAITSIQLPPLLVGLPVNAPPPVGNYNLTGIFAGWIGGELSSITTVQLPPAIIDVPVNAPPPVGNYGRPTVWAHWTGGELWPVISVQLPAPLFEVVVNDPPFTGASNVTADLIAASWRPPDAQAPVAGHLNPRLEAVPVNNPPFASGLRGQTDRLASILTTWIPPDPAAQLKPQVNLVVGTTTWWILATAGVSPNFFGNLKEGGDPPTIASTAYGYAPSNTSLATPYFRSRLGATGPATPGSSASSFIAATSGPTAGTGSGSSTAGDSFVTPNAYSGVFANTAWTFNFTLRASTAGAVGNLNLRVWAASSPDGVGARELTSGLLAGALVTLTTTGDVNSGLTWTPGPIALDDEYLFFQLEWLEAFQGALGSNVRFRAGTGSILSPQLVPGIPDTPPITTRDGLSSIVASWVPPDPAPHQRRPLQQVPKAWQASSNPAQLEVILTAWVPPDPPSIAGRHLTPGSVDYASAGRRPDRLTTILGTWVPPDPVPTLLRYFPQTVTTLVGTPTPESTERVVSGWVTVDAQAPARRLLAPALIAVPADIPPRRRQTPGILEAWIAPDPAQVLRPYSPIPPPAPAPFQPFTSPVPAEIIASWAPPDAQAPVVGRLNPAFLDVPVADAPKGRRPDRLTQIIASWTPPDAQAPVGQRLNPAIEAVVVTNPPSIRPDQSVAILGSWIPADPTPFVPRYLTQVTPPIVNDPPFGGPAATTPALIETLVSWIPGEVAQPKQRRVTRSPPQFITSTRPVVAAITGILASWIPPDPQPQVARQLNPAFEAVPVSVVGPQTERLNDIVATWVAADPPIVTQRFVPQTVVQFVASRSRVLDRIVTSAWAPPDAQAPLARITVPLFAVNKPPIKGVSTARESILASWAPQAPVPILPRFLARPPVMETPAGRRPVSVVETILNAWVEVPPQPIIGGPKQSQVLSVNKPPVSTRRLVHNIIDQWFAPSGLLPILQVPPSPSTLAVQVDNPPVIGAYFDNFYRVLNEWTPSAFDPWFTATSTGQPFIPPPPEPFHGNQIFEALGSRTGDLNAALRAGIDTISTS